MYVPRLHQFTDAEALLSLLESNPLATWACCGAGGLVVNHIPFFLDRHRGEHGTLIGHVSKANRVWRELSNDSPSIMVFQGAEAYISPNWYPGKTEHGKVVPTWNYAVAHAHGVAHAVHDRGWMLDMLNRLTSAQEIQRPDPWRVSDAPASYVDRMMDAIVGIEMPIQRMEGKLKASQDEDMQDRIGTSRALRGERGDKAQAMADLVLKEIERNRRVP